MTYIIFIQGCSFKNFIYEFNSLIEPNSYGGKISIEVSNFERFGTCGSIVRNYKNTLKLKTIDTSTSPYEIVLMQRHSRLETELFSDREYRNNLFLKSPFDGKCATNHADITYFVRACFSLSITDSEFRYFNYGMTPITSPVFVDASNGMQYHGKILQLKNFQGPITISNNIFENNSLAI